MEDEQWTRQGIRSVRTTHVGKLEDVMDRLYLPDDSRVGILSVVAGDCRT